MRLSKRGKRRLALVATVALVAVIGAVAFKTLRRVQQTRLYNAARVDGLAAHGEGDLETTIDRLSYYIQSGASSDVEALMAFGDARAEVPMVNDQHVTDAIGLYKLALEALDEEPDQPERAERQLRALVRLVDLHGSAGLYFEQIGYADRVLELAPKNVEALEARATARVIRRTRDADGGQRDLDLALADAQHLVEIDPDDVRWRQLELEIMRFDARPLAEMIKRVEDWEELEGDPDGRYHVLLAGLLAADRQYDKARSAMETAFERRAETIDVVKLKISMLDELRMKDQADDLIKWARERFSAQWVFLVEARRLLAEDESEAALATIRAAREKFETLEPDLLKLEARILLESGRRGELSVVLDELLDLESLSEAERDAVHAWARAVHAWSNLEEQGWAEVLDRLDQALGLQQRDPTLHLLKGETLSVVGERTRATESFRRARELDGGWVHAVLRYAQSIIDVGRPTEAFAILYEKYIWPVIDGRSDLRLIRPFVVGAQAYVAMLRADSSVRSETGVREAGAALAGFVESVQKQAPENRDVAVILVELYEQIGQHAEARQFLEDAVADQASVGVLLALADTTRRVDLGALWTPAERARVERALVERAEELGGRTTPVVFALANLAAEEGRLREALESIDEVLVRPDLTDGETLRAARARLSFMERSDHPDLAEELRRFQDTFAAVPEAQAYVLSVQERRNEPDPELVNNAVDALGAALGEDAHQVRLARAWSHLRFGGDDEAELAKAIKILQALVKDAPESVAAHNLLAEALIEVDPASRIATKHLRDAVDLAPGRAALYPTLIARLQMQGDTESASRYLGQLSTLGAADANARRAELALLARQGDFETALARSSGLEDELSGKDEQLWLAALSRRAGDFEKAEAIYTTLLAGEHKPLVAFDAATCFADQGRLELGVDLLERRAESDRALLLGQFYQRCGDPTLAHRWFVKAIHPDTDSAAARLALARFLLAQGGPANVAEALQHAERGLQLAPDDEELLSTLAMAQIAGGGDSTLPARELRKLIGDNEDLLAMLRFIEELRASDSAGTPDMLDAARELTAEHGSLPQVWMLASRLHGRAGRFDDAIELARAAVDRFPASPGPAELATQLLIVDGRWSEAVIEAGRWRRRSLGNPLPVDETIAYLYLQLDQPGSAVAQLEPYAARIDAEADRQPRRFEIWLQALIADGRRAAALESISERLSQPQWRRRWVRVAMSLQDESAEWAMSKLPEAEIVHPGEQLALAGAWHGLATRSGRVEHDEAADAWAAMAMAGRAAQRNPMIVRNATVVRGAIAEGRGETVRAETLYREVLEQDPDHAVALNNLAFLLASTDRPAEAVTLAERAVALLPPESAGPANDDAFRRAAVLDTYAHALLAAGRVEEAEQSVKRALRLSPFDPTIMLTLAQTLMAAGDLTSAEEQLDLATARLAIIRRPERSQIERAETLRKQLETRLSAESRAGSGSRFSEATPVDGDS